MVPKPKTIRVTKKKPQVKFIKRVGAATLRLTVLRRDNFTCKICDNPYPEYNLECDHIIPLSKGGEDNVGNCQTLCINCHRTKSEKEKYDV